MEHNFEHGGTIFAVARQLGLAPEEMLDFSASINPLGPAPGVRTAVAAAFDRLVHYPDSDSACLRQALADCHNVPAEQLCVANGSTELIHLLPRLSRFTRKRALLLAPTFSEYAHSLEICGWDYDYLPLPAAAGFTLDLAKLQAALTREYELLFLCNPGNPTGRLYRREEVSALLEICRASATFLVIDEAFMDFCEEESARELLLREDAALILRSMTKFYGFPGLRLGYAFASAGVVSELERLRPPWSVGTLAQAAAIVALADADHAARTRLLVAAERQRLAEELQLLGQLRVYPGAANYLLLESRSGRSAAELQRRLLEQRILIRNCSNFVGLDEHFFRVAVRSRAENDRLLRGLAEALG